MGSELAPPTSVSGSMMDLWKMVAGALPQMKDGLSAPPVSRVTYIGKGEVRGGGGGMGWNQGARDGGRRKREVERGNEEGREEWGEVVGEGVSEGY